MGRRRRVSARTAGPGAPAPSPSRARAAPSAKRPRASWWARSRVLPCERFEDVFRSLKEGRAEGAVVPIENTLAGSVHENYDHLLNFELPIVAETSVRIVHNLIARKACHFPKSSGYFPIRWRSISAWISSRETRKSKEFRFTIRPAA